MVLYADGLYFAPTKHLAMEITPIYSVDRHTLGDEAGKITRRLHQMYLDCVTGILEDTRQWLTPIYAEGDKTTCISG